MLVLSAVLGQGGQYLGCRFEMDSIWAAGARQYSGHAAIFECAISALRKEIYLTAKNGWNEMWEKSSRTVFELLVTGSIPVAQLGGKVLCTMRSFYFRKIILPDRENGERIDRIELISSQVRQPDRISEVWRWDEWNARQYSGWLSRTVSRPTRCLISDAQFLFSIYKIEFSRPTKCLISDAQFQNLFSIYKIGFSRPTKWRRDEMEWVTVFGPIELDSISTDQLVISGRKMPSQCNTHYFNFARRVLISHLEF